MNIPNPPTGSSALAAYLAKMIRAMRASEIKAAPGYTVDRTTGGTLIRIDPAAIQAAALSGDVTRMKINTEEDTYLVCRAYDGESEDDTDINVSKPERLQTQPTWAANLTVDYSVGAEIFAVKPIGGTGNTEAPDWIDLNVDARDWCYEHQFKDSNDSCTLKRLYINVREGPTDV